MPTIYQFIYYLFHFNELLVENWQLIRVVNGIFMKQEFVFSSDFDYEKAKPYVKISYLIFL